MSSSRSQKIILGGIFAGLILGGLLGWIMGPRAVMFAWLGEIFLRALKMIIVPLIVTSMIVGITSLGDVRRLGRTGLVTVIYYVVTTALAVVVGLILVNIIRPGVGAMQTINTPELLEQTREFSFFDVLLGMVPENLVTAAADLDILPLIVFSLLFGATLTTIGEKGAPLVRLFEVVNDVIMRLVHLIMWFAPIGVFGLVAGKLGEVGGGAAFLEELIKVGKYALTVMIGLFFHALVILPVLLSLLGRRPPWRYLRNMIPALTTAFSTASSSATLPVTFECVEGNNKVSSSSADLVLPLGATINMDGTALYEAVAAMFIAQSYGIQLGLGEQLVVFFTATLAAIGAAGIPQAGLVTMVLVLQSVGLPLEGIGVILSIDWFLDRWRTTINVWGDSVGAAVVERWQQRS
jgi:Na+/H+-dicarboxylate symporter